MKRGKIPPLVKANRFAWEAWRLVQRVLRLLMILGVLALCHLMIGGQIASAADFAQNPDGPVAVYHPNGQVRIEATLDNGRLVGTWTEYYPNGQVSRTGEAYGSAYGLNRVDAPLKTGRWLEFSWDGTLVFEGTYENDLLVGRAVAYHHSGELLYEAMFESGRLAGTWTEYHPNGQVRMTGEAYGSAYGLNTFYDPLKTGRWLEFSWDGRLLFEGTYENDLLVGRAAKYYETGELRYEGTFEAGRLSGRWTEYHDNGQIRTSGQAYDSDYGLNIIDFPLKTGPWLVYGWDGTLLFEGTYENNLLVGRAAAYFPDTGLLQWEGTMQGGHAVGTWTEYYWNGQIRETGVAKGSEFPNDYLYPIREGLWLYFHSDGSLIDARFYLNNVDMGSVEFVKDPYTDLNRLVVKDPSGSRTVYDVGREGIVTSRRDAIPIDIEAVVDYQVDPETGEIRIVRKDAEGALVTSTGRRYVDDQGSVHISEIDEHGNQRETVISPDGSTVIVTTRADGSQSIVDLDPIDGLSLFETLADGTSVRTTRDPWNGALVTERFDAEGNLVETTTQRPDGWIEAVDRYGNVRTRYVDEDGRTITIELDRNGNVTTAVADPSGEVIRRERALAAPVEPGRNYYETVIGGTDWDALSPSMKDYFAASERDAQEAELKLAEIRAEQEEADRRAAERQALEERRRAIEESRERARELQRQYDEAVARGDMDEARRIMALQDEHHDASTELLMPTESERQEMERLAEVRHRLTQAINQGALERSQLDIFNAERGQDIKDSVTELTKWVSVGSEMQQQTSRTTRMAERERAWARAQIEQIDAMLEAGGWSDEERKILLERRELAVLQEDGAIELLAANGRITTAGYIIDGVTTVTGAGAATAAGRTGTMLVTSTARRLGSEGIATAAEVAAARVGSIASMDVSSPAIAALGSAARRVLGDAPVDVVSAAAGRVAEVGRTDVSDLTARLADTLRFAPEPTAAAYKTPAERASTVLENAPSLQTQARTERIKLPSEMTPAERQAYHDRLAREQMRGRWNLGDFGDVDDYDDVLVPIGSVSPVDPRPFTVEEVRRLHEVGRNLSREEIIRKAELYRLRYEAERLAEKAPTEAERIAYADRYRQLREIIDDQTPTVIIPAPGGASSAPLRVLGAPADVPPDIAAFTTIIDRPARFAAAEPGTEILTAVEFPPLTESVAPLPSASLPPPPPPPPPPPLPPLRVGSVPERPVIEWPVGPYIHGLPGPGVGMHHIEAAQRVASETGVPIVIFGSRQTGVRHSTGGPFGPTSDLDIGVVGPPESLARVLRHGIETRIPNVEHGPMGRFDSIDDALRQGFLVVSPIP